MEPENYLIKTLEENAIEVLLNINFFINKKYKYKYK